MLVYDKVSFVSAKSWAENPRLKQAALLSALTNDTEPANEIKAKSGSLAIKKARAKIIRAGLRLNPGDFLLSHTVSGSQIARRQTDRGQAMAIPGRRRTLPPRVF